MAVTPSVWLDALKAALCSRGMMARTLKEQMAECSARGQLTRYGDLPAWPDYQKACDEVTRLEEAYIETVLPCASNAALS